MSKHAIAGEPINVFIKRGVGAKGCWLTNSKKTAYSLQRHIGSSAYRNGLSVISKTMPCIDEETGKEASVKYTVIIQLVSTKP